MEEDFIFSQSDLMSSSFSVFEGMRKNCELVDLKITIENRSFVVHRLVLAAVIPYFRVGLSSCVNETLLQGIDPDAFESVINFAYSGKIKISSRNVLTLLVAAQSFQLDKLYKVCVKFIELRVDASNIFEGRQLAGNLQCLQLAAAFDNFFLRNFSTLCMTNEFLHLPFPYLKVMIGNDDLNIVNEEILFEAVLRWIQISPAERYCFLPELFSEVRLSRLSPEYLITRVASEGLIQSSVACKNLIEEAKNYCLLAKNCSVATSTATWPRNNNGHGLYATGDSVFGFTVELYNSEKKTWISLAADRSLSGRVKVIGFNERIYAVKGICYDFDMSMFDLKTRKWEKLKSHKYKSYIYSLEGIVLHSNKFYVFLPHDVVCFDPVLNEWESLKLDVDCEEAGFASVGNYIYVTGGRVTGSAVKSTKRCFFDIRSINKNSSMLVERRRHGCTALYNKVYVCGGIDKGGSILKSAEVYDPETYKWSFISSMMGVSCLDINLLPYNGKLHAFSRESTPEVYYPQLNEWKADCALLSPSMLSCSEKYYAVIPKATDDKEYPEPSTSLPRFSGSRSYDSASRTTNTRISLQTETVRSISTYIRENTTNESFFS